MIIFRYLSKEILAMMLATTLLLLVIFITNQSLQFLQRAALGQLPATEMLHVIVLQIPLLLPYILPLGLYLGVLLTLSRMHLELEMTVLAACGVSRAQLTGMIAMIALVVAVIVGLLMSIVVPQAQGDLNRIFDKAAVSASVDQVIPGRFMVFDKKSRKPIVFYAKSVQHHSILHHVFLAQESKDFNHTQQEKWSVIVAKTVLEKRAPGEDSHYLIFDNGYRYSGVPGEENYHTMRFNQYITRLTLGDVPKSNASQDYSLSKLWSLSSTDKQAAAELQWRMAIPISTLLFALLAVPLSEVRPRYGKFTQLLPAILIYMGYADLIFLTRSWIGSGRLSPELGMWWVHGAVLLLIILLMMYRFGWRRMRFLFSKGVVA